MLQKRLDYGVSGYQVPFVPRAARSSRKRGPVQKQAVGGDQLCAFDLLATVAGKILLEGESPETLTRQDSSNGQDVVMEKNDEGIPSLNVEHCDLNDEGCAGASSPSLTLELGLRGLERDHNVKELSGPSGDVSSTPSSVVTLSDGLGKETSLTKIDLNDDKSEFCSHTGNLERFALGNLEPYVPLVDAFASQHDGSGELFGNGSDTHSSEDPEMLDGKPLALVGPESINLSLGNGHYPCGLQAPCRDNNVDVVSRDDDENSSECIQPSTIKTTRLPARVSDRRIRKLFPSKYRRIASKARDGDLSDNEARYLYRARKIGYKRQRSQRIYPFKKRKYFRYSSLSNPDGDIGFKSVYKSRDKAIEKKSLGFGSVMHGVNGSSACVAGQTAAFSSRESQVKLRIKSFRVPELFIEMPESATIGSLKRTVMEAVSALLGGGLRVGVLLQGKKVRDDSRTLLQSGICHDNKAESLGFTLEPNPSPVSAPLGSEDSSFVRSLDVPQTIPRCPIKAPAIQQGTSYLPLEHLDLNLGNLMESDHDSAPSPADMSAEKRMASSHALVSFPDGTPEALAVVHSNQKFKRCELGQRRIRRPFSVAEVEALVHAVEKLGTGRWRDVKLRAFDSVKHRTYVDLKDKWKTLVHTARIAPQQRRGEPVPQELLDRVLAAHAYWSQQQAKQQLKQQPSEACLLL